METKKFTIKPVDPLNYSGKWWVMNGKKFHKRCQTRNDAQELADSLNRVKKMKDNHKHKWSYSGGECKCTVKGCGKFLQPGGSVTKTATGRYKKTKKIKR